MLAAVAIACYQALVLLLTGWVVLNRVLPPPGRGHNSWLWCFLSGFAAYPILAYPLLVLTGSARASHIGVLLIVGAAAVFLRRREPEDPLLSAIQRVTRASHGPAAWISLAICAGFVITVFVVRMAAVTQPVVEGNLRAFGFGLYDDMRTVGFPLSLAAWGYPLRSPYAPEVKLLYPLGSFLFNSALIEFLPGRAAAVLLADITITAIFYTLALRTAICLAVSHSAFRVMAVLSALVASSINLWRLHPPMPNSWPWFDLLFGYWRVSNYFSTTAWTPLSGFVWVPVHALAIAAGVLGTVILIRALAAGPVPSWPVVALTATLFGYAAVGSMDATVMLMLASAAAVLVAWHIYARTGAALLPCAVAFGTATILWIAVEAPALLGFSDAPYLAGVWTRDPWPNIGIFASTFGPLLLAILAMIVLGRRPTAATWIAAASLAPLLPILAASQWDQIWYWRGSLLLQSSIAILAGCAADAVPPGRRKAVLAIWILPLLVGAVQFHEDVAVLRTNPPRRSPDFVQAVNWLNRNTPLDARVVSWQKDQQSLVPDVSFLRTGNRAGKSPFDRVFAYAGYQGYLRSMTDVAEGLARNDYILDPRDDPEFDRLLRAAGAPTAFENRAVAIYRIDDRARSRLNSSPLREISRQFMEREQLRAASANDTSAADRFLALYEMDPNRIRARAEQFWSKGDCGSAIRMLGPVADRLPRNAEARYSYAYSLMLCKESNRAIEEFDAAQRLGYFEFWVRYGRATAYADLREFDAARRELERARPLYPEHRGAAALLNSVVQAAKRSQ